MEQSEPSVSAVAEIQTLGASCSNGTPIRTHNSNPKPQFKIHLPYSNSNAQSCCVLGCTTQTHTGGPNYELCDDEKRQSALSSQQWHSKSTQISFVTLGSLAHCSPYTVWKHKLVDFLKFFCGHKLGEIRWQMRRGQVVFKQNCNGFPRVLSSGCNGNFFATQRPLLISSNIKL